MCTTSQPLITALLIVTILACNKSAENHAVEQLAAPSSISESEPPEVNASSNAASGGTSAGSGSYASGFSFFNVAANDVMGSITSNFKSPDNFISSIAAIEDGKDTIHQFIRTADLLFKVKSVTTATYKIEDIVRHFGGWVEHTSLTSTIDNTTLISVSKDSSLETTYYTVRNQMQIRVPNTQLDTVLKSIAVLVDFLDHRIVDADDVSLKILAKKLEQKRLKEYDQRVEKAIDEKAAKLKDVSLAEEELLNKQQQADQAKIDQLNLIDRIRFSAISMQIYQSKSTKREMVANDQNIDEYKPSFASRMLEAIKSGWYFLQEAALVIARLWWLLGFIIIVIIIYRMFRKNSRSSAGDLD